ncbi:MAG: PQQ-binding-like beta-propeller repeat protein [Candidatus Eisenbacteria bacterium]
MDGATGEFLWYKAYGSQEGLDESVYDIAVDGAGNAFVTGRQMNGDGGDDIMTMKLRASDGEILWRVHEGGAAMLADRGWAIAVGPDGHPVVTGVLTTAADPALYCTVKYDSDDGSEIWKKTFPGAVNYVETEAGWLAVLGDGDIVMANRTWTTLTSYDVVLHRYDGTTGDTAWTTTYNSGGTAGDDPRFMTRDGAGDILVAGIRSGNYMVAKFDASDGGLLWDASYDGPSGGYDRAAYVMEGSGGEILATGFSTGEGTSWDVTTVGFDPADGAELWAVHFDPGEGRGDEGKCLAISDLGDVYVVGYGDFEATGSDMLALRYSLPQSTGVGSGPYAGAPGPGFRVGASPNPFVNRLALSIDMERPGPARVAVYDLRGRRTALIHDGDLSSGRHDFDWDGRDEGGRRLAAGVYFVRFEGAGAEGARKVILSR